jgi:hypothetical protein
LADVAGNLIAQFAKRLEADVLGGSTGPAPTAGTDAPAARLAATEQADADDSVDLLKVVALLMAKRFAPVVAGVVAGAAVGFLLGRSRRRAQAHPAAEDLLAALSRLLS